MARWVTFLVWAAVAASTVAWGVKLLVTPPPAPPDLRVADAGVALRADTSRVLGADLPAPTSEQAAPVADARFQLIGVVAPRTSRPVHEGVALIAVDGKPPKAFRIGAAVDGATVLKSVRARGADLGPRDGATSITLDIPPPAPPAIGVLAPAGVPTGTGPGGARSTPRPLAPPAASPVTSSATAPATPVAPPAALPGVVTSPAPATASPQRGVNPFVPPPPFAAAPSLPSPVTTPSQAVPLPPSTRNGGGAAQIQ